MRAVKGERDLVFIRNVLGFEKHMKLYVFLYYGCLYKWSVGNKQELLHFMTDMERWRIKFHILELNFRAGVQKGLNKF